MSLDNGVVGLLKGRREGRCVAVRADMDALPITETKVSEYQSKKPGVMHACGHDAHVAIALGVSEILAKQRDELSGSVKFIFQPAEEGMPPEFKGDWGAKLMHRTLKGVTEAHGATYEMTYREGYPAIHNPAALAERCVATLKRVGGDGNVLPVMAGMGGEDFSYFAQQIPGFFYRIGTANVARGIVASGHTPDFDIDEESLKHGVISMTALVQDFLAEGR